MSASMPFDVPVLDYV